MNNDDLMTMNRAQLREEVIKLRAEKEALSKPPESSLAKSVFDEIAVAQEEPRTDIENVDM